MASGQVVDFFSPSGLVIGIHPEASPHMARPPVTVLDGDGALNLAESMIHEGPDMLLTQDVECLVLEEVIDGW